MVKVTVTFLWEAGGATGKQLTNEVSDEVLSLLEEGGASRVHIVKVEEE